MKSLVACLLMMFAGSIALSQPKKTDDAKRAVNIERGKYLIEQVAQCVQCHTPREANGELIRSRLLDGAAIPVGKPSWANVWAEFAPRIAGLPQYTNEQAIRLLTTGIGKDAKPLRAPMPTFKLALQDAQDIVAYLKSAK